MDETLVAVDDAAEVDAGLRVCEHGCKRALLNDNREGRRRNDVGVAGGLSREHVEVGWAVGLYRVGEFADLFATNQIRRGRRVLLALNVYVYHLSSLAHFQQDGGVWGFGSGADGSLEGMKIKSTLIKVVCCAALVVAAVGSSGASASMASGLGTAPGTGAVSFRDQPSCGKPTPGHVACLAIQRTAFRRGIRQQAFAPDAGTSFGAHALRRAYGITTLGARYKVIAIVDAMHSGTVLSDVNGYRKMYSLPQLADCSADAADSQKLPSGQDSCFVQLAQDGSAAPAVDTTDQGWAQETALDVEMASAICPHCSILLVEADSTAFGDLKQAVATAANFKGVVAISNSYGGRDVAEPADSPYAAAAAKGIAVVASSGDAGYGVSAPASFASVIGVGGTSLVTDAGFNWLSETAWAHGGSGCSILNPKAPWQDSALTGCGGKSVVDVAAVADPATGVSVYFDGQWYSFGGTSAAAPIIAGLFAMKANFGESAGQYLWANRGALRDVTSGTNGRCTNAIFCNAGTGFDGPTGWGSPNGGGAF